MQYTADMATQDTDLLLKLGKTLSDRELEILTLLAEGLVKKQIAKRLEISYSTVDFHVRHIYEKLDVPNAPAAVNKAHRLSIFKREESDKAGGGR